VRDPLSVCSIKLIEVEVQLFLADVTSYFKGEIGYAAEFEGHRGLLHQFRGICFHLCDSTGAAMITAACFAGSMRFCLLEFRVGTLPSFYVSIRTARCHLGEQAEPSSGNALMRHLPSHVAPGFLCGCSCAGAVNRPWNAISTLPGTGSVLRVKRARSSPIRRIGALARWPEIEDTSGGDDVSWWEQRNAACHHWNARCAPAVAGKGAFHLERTRRCMRLDRSRTCDRSPRTGPSHRCRSSNIPRSTVGCPAPPGRGDTRQPTNFAEQQRATCPIEVISLYFVLLSRDESTASVVYQAIAKPGALLRTRALRDGNRGVLRTLATAPTPTAR